MKSIHSNSIVRTRARAAGVLLPLLSVSAAGAQTIINPGFETDTFLVAPGYVSGNAPITGWESTVPTRSGLNPAAGSPFADNGIIPEGTKVAFIQSNTGVGDTIIRTTVTGLTSGVKYRVNFRVNARGANLPRVKVFTDGTGDPMSFHVSPVGAGAAYRYVGYDFTATAAGHLLSVQNYTTAGDHTVVVDDFTIVPSSEAWSYAAWNGDDTSGILNDHLYTHAYSFGANAVGAIVNGVPFTPVTTINPAVTDRLTSTNLSATYGEVAHTMTGDSAELGHSFAYGGPGPLGLTLSGLKPDTQYVATIYGVAFDAAPVARAATFSSSLTPEDRYTVDVDHYGLANGLRVEYAYTTDATGTVTISYAQTGDGSFHTTAVSNREAAPMMNVIPVFTRQPAGGATTASNGFTFSVGVTGSGPISYQWQKDGHDISGATASTLALTNVTLTDSGSYRVLVTNDTGTYPSDPANFFVQELVTGVYDTGVANDGTLLADAAADPHYLLLVNPGGNTLIPAIVEQAAFVPAPWLPNSTTSRWIGPAANTTSSPGAVAGGSDGVYVYQTSFDLTGYNAATASISGSWASDNGGMEIRVNGQALTGTALTSPGFSSLTPFTITSSRTTFNAGVNTLEFYVKNDTVGFTGLRVSGLKLLGTPASANSDPVAVTDGFATSKNTALTFTAASLAANDTDPDSNPLTVTSVSAASTGGGTAVLTSGSVTYTPAAGYTGTDSFSYVLSDGAGGTATGIVQVAVLTGEVPAFESVVFSDLPASPAFRFRGTPGTSYHFQRSPDLTEWKDLTVTPAPVTGIIEFSDPAPPATRAFYRISR